MIRRVEKEDARFASVWLHECSHVRPRRAVPRVGGERAIAEKRIHIVMSAEQPAANDLVVMQRLTLAQHVVHWVRIALICWVERRDSDSRWNRSVVRRSHAGGPPACRTDRGRLTNRLPTPIHDGGIIAVGCFQDGFDSSWQGVVDSASR